MEDVSSMIQAIESYKEKEDTWSEELERFIVHVARTGDILAPWEKVQVVFKNKLCLVIDEFYSTNPYKVGKVNANAINDDFDEMKKRLLELTEEFDSPPFTIQRLCELLAEPKKNYTKCDKFMRGLEKNLMVVSSWNNTPRRLSENNDGLVNGISIGPSNGFPITDGLKPHWSNLPPSPVATTPPKIPGAPDFSDITAVALKQEEIVGDGAEQNEAHQPDSSSQEGESSATDQTDEDTDKKSVSATIISSSPPTTINIKRKIVESVEETSSSTEDETTETQAQVEESPTKKRKSEGVEVPETNKEIEESPSEQENQSQPQEEADTGDKKSTESVKTAIKSAEIDAGSGSPAKNSDSVNSSEGHLQRSETKMETSDEGSSVDPPQFEGDAKMDID